MVNEEICELHATKLTRMQVPMRYGLPLYDEARAVGDKLFPHAHSYSFVGCIIGRLTYSLKLHYEEGKNELR